MTVLSLTTAQVILESIHPTHKLKSSKHIFINDLVSNRSRQNMIAVEVTNMSLDVYIMFYIYIYTFFVYQVLKILEFLIFKKKKCWLNVIGHIT